MANASTPPPTPPPSDFDPPQQRAGGASDAPTVKVVTVPIKTGATEWSRLHLWQIQPLRDALIVLTVVGLLYIGKALSLVTVPLLLAMLLAYLAEPVVKSMLRLKWVSRQGAAITIIFGAGLIIGLPAVLGLGFGVVQGAAVVQRLSTNATLVVDVVQSRGGGGSEARDALPNQAWRDLADWLVKIRAQAERARAIRQQSAAPGAAGKPAGLGGPGGPDPKPVDGPKPVDLAADAAKPIEGQSGQSDQSGQSGQSGQSDQGDQATAAKTAAAATAAAVGVEPSRVGSDEGGSKSLREQIAARMEPNDAAAVGIYRGFEWVVAWLTDNSQAIGQRALNTGAGALGWVVGSMISIGFVVFGAFLTAFFFYFFCTGYGRVRLFWEGLIPEARKGPVIDLVSKMDVVISGFIRGRLTICAILIVYYTVAYWLIGIPVPLILGPAIGVLAIVPYAASIGLPIAFFLLYFGISPMFAFQEHWWWAIVGPLLVSGGSQILDDYVLSPAIQGKTTGMDTPTILFASLAGGVLAGFYGLLIAIPVAACVKILLHDVVWPRFRAWAEGRAKDPLPFSNK